MPVCFRYADLTNTNFNGRNQEVVKTSSMSAFGEIDYDARSDLISEKLKLLMEKFMLQYQFEPTMFGIKTKGSKWSFGGSGHPVMRITKPPIETTAFCRVFPSQITISHLSSLHVLQ